MPMIKLGAVCEVLNGYAFKSENYVENGFRIIRISNVQKGYIEDNTPVYYPLNTVGIDRFVLQEGDMLLSLTGNVGRVALLKKEFLPAVLNQRVACLRIKSDAIEKGFLFHLLNSDYFEQKCIHSSQGVAQKNMSTEWLKEYEIPLYSIDEQRDIASTLDRVQTLLSNRKKQLELLDQLVKSRFVEMFESNEYEIFNMGDVCKFQQGIQVPIEAQIDKPVEGYDRFLRIIDYTQAPQSPRYVLNNGRRIDNNSVVVVRYGASAGFVGHGYSGILANNLFEVVPNANLMTKEFLYYELKYGAFETIIRDKAFGAAMPAVSFTMIHDIPIIVPPIELQNQFADFVGQVDKSKQTIQQSIDKLETLKASLMQKYFG